MYKKIAFICTTVLGVLLVTLLLLEAGLRIYHHIKPSYIFSEDTFRFHGKPHSNFYGFKLNSLGYHDTEFKKEKADTTYRIVALGDSFAYGVVPYRYNFLTLLEEKLNESPSNLQYEVYNFGVSGINSREYYTLLVNEGLQYDPDMVIVCFFVGNDFFIFDVGATMYRTEIRSFALHYFNFLLTVLTAYEGGETRDIGDYDDTAPSMERGKYFERKEFHGVMYLKETAPLRLYDAGTGTHISSAPHRNKKIEKAFSYIKKIQEECIRRGIQLVVYLLPEELQVDMKMRRKFLSVYGYWDDNFDWFITNRLFSKKLVNNNIDFHDMSQRFIEESLKQPLYKPRDGHFNIAGNRLAAQIIYADLDDKGILRKIP
jgi:lysophospholipase L1-like esterase